MIEKQGDNLNILQMNNGDFILSKKVGNIFMVLSKNELLEVNNLIGKTIKELEGIENQKTNNNKDDVLNSKHITLEELDFSVGTYNSLKRAGVNFLDDICNFTLSNLTTIRNISNKRVKEIQNKLGEYNLSLTPEDTE